MASILLVDIRGWQGAVCGGNPFPNVGIAYLASSLKAAGHKVVVADMNNVPLDKEDVLQLISDHKCDIVGLSIKTSTVAIARGLGHFLKQHTSVPIMLGGAHATLQADELIDEPWVDYAFVGEAEKSLPLFCENLHQWKSNQFPGIRTKNGIQVQPSLVSDLDSLPFPDYSVFTWLAKKTDEFNYPLVTSRGCVFNCTYCSVPQISGKKFRKREPVQVILELQNAREQFGIKEFSIIDDSFNLDLTRAKEFCSLLLKNNMHLSWSCPNGIRADCIDQELACLMKASGCHSVMVGIESASPAILESVNKGESLEDITRGIGYLKEAGLSVGGYFLIGLPGDSYSAQGISVAYALRHGISAHFNMLVPYPGTELYVWAKKHGRFLLSVEEGVHFSDCIDAIRPVFDTPDFPAGERIKAFEMVHTRLARFDMLIPSRFGKIKYYIKALMLLFQYDRRQIFKRVWRRLLGS